MNTNTDNNHFEKAYFLCSVAIEQCQIVSNIINDIKTLIKDLEDEISSPLRQDVQ